MVQAEVNAILETFIAWANTQDDVHGLLLVGSWARGTARPDSDIDLIILTTRPEHYRADTTWHDALHLLIASWQDEDYGALWSRRLLLHDGSEIEVGFTMPAWANVEPVDGGTRRVVADGCRVLVDKAGVLQSLVRVVQQMQ